MIMIAACRDATWPVLRCRSVFFAGFLTTGVVPARCVACVSPGLAGLTTWAASAYVPRAESPGDAERDHALLTAFIQKQPSAAKAVWERFYPLVSRTLRRTFGPQDEVADLVQDVFFHLFRKLPGLRDPTALRSFVYSITTRVALKELRRRRLHRWLELSPSGTLPEGITVPRDPGAPAALRRLYEILDELAPRDRTLFVLRNLEDMSLPELAQATGVSLATVKRRLKVAGDHVAQRAASDALLASYLSSTVSSTSSPIALLPQQETTSNEAEARRSGRAGNEGGD